MIDADREHVHNVTLGDMTAAELRALADRAEQREKARTRKRPRCGAKTRAGSSCRRGCIEGRSRCALHGGLSTGPRSPEGREAIRAANRRRSTPAIK